MNLVSYLKKAGSLTEHASPVNLEMFLEIAI